MDDFLVPANESVEIIRDNDTIQVKAVAASSHHNGATAANNSWSVDQSEESPAKKSKPSTSPKPVKMKLPKKRKNKKLKVKNRTEDTSKKQSEGNDSVTTFFQNLLNAPLRTSQLPGKDRVMSTPTTASKNTTRKPAGQKPGLLKAVTKQVSSGALHTKFRSSSSGSEPDEQTSLARDITPKLTSTPKGGSTSNKSTPGSSSAKRPVRSNQSKAARTSFPAIVGGPRDSFTTKSVIYKRAEKAVSESSSESSSDDTSKEETPSKAAPPSKVIPSPKTTPPSSSLVPPPFEATSLPGPTAAREESTAAVPGGVGSSRSLEKVLPEEKSVRDYASLPALLGAPRIGDMIAFKVLELSADCTPQFSDYKEATVLTFDAESMNIQLELTESTLKQERKRAVERSHGKLSMPMEDEQAELQCAKEIELSLQSMVEPKLVS